MNKRINENNLQIQKYFSERNSLRLTKKRSNDYALK